MTKKGETLNTGPHHQRYIRNGCNVSIPLHTPTRQLPSSKCNANGPPFCLANLLSCPILCPRNPIAPIMATTGLAAAGHTKYDATTPPKPSSLPQDVVGKLLVNLDKEIEVARKVSFDLWSRWRVGIRDKQEKVIRGGRTARRCER